MKRVRLLTERKRFSKAPNTFSSNIVNTESGDYPRDFDRCSRELSAIFFFPPSSLFSTAKESRKDFTLGQKVEGGTPVGFVEPTESFC